MEFTIEKHESEEEVQLVHLPPENEIEGEGRYPLSWLFQIFFVF